MHCKSYSHLFSKKKKIQHICISLDVNFNESLTNDVVSFEQLGPDCVVCLEYSVYPKYVDTLSPYHNQPVSVAQFDVRSTNDQGPVVQSVVSLTSLRVISLTVLADSIHNILIFFAEKCE